jgi:hypothetical protein
MRRNNLDGLTASVQLNQWPHRFPIQCFVITNQTNQSTDLLHNMSVRFCNSLPSNLYMIYINRSLDFRSLNLFLSEMSFTARVENNYSVFRLGKGSFRVVHVGEFKRPINVLTVTAKYSLWGYML